MAVTDWSSTAANNTTLGGIALGEGVMLVADVNDAFRELMAQVAAALGVSIQEYDAGLASIAGLATAADRMIYTTASDTYAVATLTAFARTLLDDADQATAQATLGVDPAGTDNSTDVTLAGALDYITITGQTITRNPIDLTTDVTGDLPVTEGGTGASDAATARTNLGLGSLATLNTVNNGNWSGTDLAVTNGGTGASNASGARTNLGAAASATTISAGTGLSGGGDLSANRTLSLDIASQGEAEAGTDNAHGMTPLRTAQAIAALGGDAFGAALLHVRDEKTSGTDGGTFTSGARRTRDLNTVKTNEISGASVGSNQVTLPAGTYFLMASAPARKVQRHKAFWRNTTDGADTLVGTSAFCDSGETSSGDQVRSYVVGRFTIAASKVFELQHECNSTTSTSGFGVATSLGVEVYSEVMIWKVG